MKSLRAVVTGRVQGVGFRWAIRDRAIALGITGWVRNRRDGTVELHAEGTEPAVNSFARWFREGPPLARVADVALSEEPATQATEFTIDADD